MNAYSMGSSAAMRFEPQLEPPEFYENPKPDDDEELTPQEIVETRLEFQLQVLGF